MRTKHRVTLSNGEIVLLEEGDGRLSIASTDSTGYPDMWVCEINQDGVLVFPNSGHGCETIVNNLKENK